MFPPVHPAVAYLLYSAARRRLDGTPPDASATAAVVAGAVIPDLVDQPLAALALVPTTRALGHSLLFVVPVCLVGVLVVRRRWGSNASATAFAVGALSHPLADALWPLVLGLLDELGFLLWPITPSPPYEGTKPLLDLGAATVTTLWVELVLLALALVVWWRDGRPGLGAVGRRVSRAPGREG